MGWFSRKKKKVPYIPQGRIGYYRKWDTIYGYYYVIVVEEIGRIGIRRKVKILEVDIFRDCSKSEKQCLDNYGMGDWVKAENFSWESEDDKARRLMGIPEQTYMINEDDVDEDIQYRHIEEENRTLTPHNFITD
jgi:hypothetical protein